MALHFFSLFFFLFSFSFLAVHSLSTVAVSETSNRTLICALRPTANQRSFLSCSGADLQIPEPNRNNSYSGVVAGDGFVCALSSSSSNSKIDCWRFSANSTNAVAKRIYNGSAITDLEAGNSHYCGLVNATNRLLCWPWKDFSNFPSAHNKSFASIAVGTVGTVGHDFICGLSESGTISCLGTDSTVLAQVPQGKYSLIAAGFEHACALTPDNDLHCWGDTQGLNIPQGKFKSLALGKNRGCGLSINDTLYCWGRDNFSLPENLRHTFFVSIEAKRSVFCGVVRSSFDLICWGNQNLNSSFSVFQDVMPGPCRSVCPCGILGGSARFCSEGFVCEHCFNKTVTLPPASPPPPSSDDGWSGKMIAFFVVGCVGCSVVLLAIGFFLFKYCNCKGCRVHDSGRLDENGAPLEQGTEQQQPQPVLEKRLSQLASMGNAGHLEEFSLQAILQATNNFAEDFKVGAGSFGVVYLGILDDGREVAIKRAETSSTSSYAIGTRRQEDKDNAFIHELESLSRLHHKNLVRLLGFCEDSNELVLVYEYMSNGTLSDHLHKLENSPLLSWPARIKVALDAARGLEYLHEYAVPRIIHRDIKSSNILLDSSWTAKVSDFGLSLMGPEDEDSHLSERAAGTVGYIDPEYYRLQQLTTKSDVYSFGVVLLELLSGQKAIHKNENGVPRNVVDFVVPYIVQDEIHRVLDSRVSPPTPFEIEAVAYVGYLAADCVTLEGRDRPPMSEIVNSLERALAACLVHPTSLSRSTTGSST